MSLPAQPPSEPIGFDYLGLTEGLVGYRDGWARQREVHAQVADRVAPPKVLFVEHDHVFTAGHRTQPHERPIDGTEVVDVDRGGKITYHGPGQLVVYMMIDFKRLGLGVRELVRHIEQAVIDLLAEFGITGNGDVDAPGVYVDGAKIASLGLRIRNHATYHGLSLNVDMDLTPFSWINPCGYSGLRVTQLRELGVTLDVNAVAERLLPHLRAQLAAH